MNLEQSLGVLTCPILEFVKKGGEKIKLSSDYNTALKEIEENLEFWDPEVIHKCKQKMTKLTEYHERIQYLREWGDPIHGS